MLAAKIRLITDNISMHNFPKDRKLRHEWEKFVRTHRPDFRARGDNISCSDHFKKECYNGPKLNVGNLKFNRRLIPGSIPTEEGGKKKEEEPSAREQRHNRRSVLTDHFGPVPHKRKRTEENASDGPASSASGVGQAVVSGGVGQAVVSGGVGQAVVSGGVGQAVVPGGVGRAVVSGGVGQAVVPGGVGRAVVSGGVGQH
ncbi:predicted protein [Nematostella vectensis]|uniref:THAP-type domain-containing protein n=1 Tax=Nematostella vectensis TaxID=45351 RepID=A7RV55_NEMVE|nr:predicted protein [Nematostella vectensis]|eukprot:XP_001636754.1 predicted protein [Nematostella vectensis]